MIILDSDDEVKIISKEPEIEENNKINNENEEKEEE